MQISVTTEQGNILKVQRPKMRGKNPGKLLIYSRDFRIPITLIPDTGTISAALGNRMKAYFSYTLDGKNITLGQEVYCQD